tara:strand:+ start:1340 stop:2314 length:975 start_codon:yes stop_codon:yes gene_type:complete
MEAGLNMVKQKALMTGLPAGRLRIVSIGECMVELAPAATPGQLKQAFAGDTFNTIYYTKLLRPDWHARYLSRVGADQISADMLAQMAAHGLDVSHIRKSETRTVGLYLISLANGERSFAYWRGQSAARQLAEDPQLVAAAIADADIVFFSGITMAILEPDTRAGFLDAIATARKAGKTIAFDPNMRPRLWRDADEMRETIMRAAAASDIVLPSFDEESAQFGDIGPSATIARYQAVGAASVVVKNGPGAVCYAHCGQSGEVQPDPVGQLVDSTSAGDSFNAGLFAGLAQFGRIEPAIELASGVARQVIGQRGALVPLDLDALQR